MKQVLTEVAKEGFKLANTNLGSCFFGAVLAHLLTKSHREGELQSLKDELAGARQEVGHANEDLAKLASDNRDLNAEFLKTLGTLGSVRADLAGCERVCDDTRRRFDSSWCIWRQPGEVHFQQASSGLDNS